MREEYSWNSRVASCYKTLIQHRGSGKGLEHRVSQGKLLWRGHIWTKTWKMKCICFGNLGFKHCGRDYSKGQNVAGTWGFEEYKENWCAWKREPEAEILTSNGSQLSKEVTWSSLLCKKTILLLWGERMEWKSRVEAGGQLGNYFNILIKRKYSLDSQRWQW